jgi:hypothetical protein
MPKVSPAASASSRQASRASQTEQASRAIRAGGSSTCVRSGHHASGSEVRHGTAPISSTSSDSHSQRLGWYRPPGTVRRGTSVTWPLRHNEMTPRIERAGTPPLIVGASGEDGVVDPNSPYWLLLLASALGGAVVAAVVAVALKVVDLQHRHDEIRRDHYVAMHTALDDLHQALLDGVTANNRLPFDDSAASDEDIPKV